MLACQDDGRGRLPLRANGPFRLRSGGVELGDVLCPAILRFRQSAGNSDCEIPTAYKDTRGYASGQRPWRARWSAAKRSGSNGGLGLLVRLPIPGKQLGDFVSRMIWKPGQHVSEPGLRIDVVHLAGFDQGIDGGGTMATSV